MHWTRNQLLAALNFHHRSFFGRQRSTYPPIVELVEPIGRMHGAVAMKLNNFTPLDPVELNRGTKSLTGASKVDRALWDEFSGRMNDLADESEAVLERFAADKGSDKDSATPVAPETKSPTGFSETRATVSIRRQQRIFRRAVLASYGHRCCFTANSAPELLRASHIIPSAETEEHRANPRNGLCIAATFAAAFDRGLIAFGDNYRLLLSPRRLPPESRTRSKLRRRRRPEPAPPGEKPARSRTHRLASVDLSFLRSGPSVPRG